MKSLPIDNTIQRSNEPILKVKGLKTTFITKNGDVRAVNGLDFNLNNGQRMAIIGESGCGKSVLAQTILNLLPNNAQVSGEILFQNSTILNQSDDQMVALRGKLIGLIPQHLSSLNPLMKTHLQIEEAIQPDGGSQEKNDISRKMLNLLNSVGLRTYVSERHPHQLSGGMNRRVLISMGIAQNPSLLLADEPTTGLDTILRHKTVKLLDRITQDRSLLLITHDINVARLCETIAVMYAGEIIEKGSAEEILENPKHPYTEGLIASMPSRGMSSIPGLSPSLIEIPSGCRFHPRCPLATEQCMKIHPVLNGEQAGVRCHAYS